MLGPVYEPTGGPCWCVVSFLGGVAAFLDSGFGGAVELSDLYFVCGISFVGFLWMVR